MTRGSPHDRLGSGVIVVGAGIVGAACAEALARGGLPRDRARLGRSRAAAATAAAMGHLVVMDDSEAQFALTAHSRRLWSERGRRAAGRMRGRRVRDALGGRGRRRDGARAGEGRLLSRPRGEVVEILDARALRDAEPRLRDGLVGALRVAGDRVVYPPTAARFFLEKARAAGASVELGVRVETLEPGRVRCGGEWREADLVVNAAGPEAPRLTPGLPIVPRKGHLVITDRYPGFLRHQVVELGYLKSAHTLTRESVAFNVQPRKTGQLLVGSSRELVDWDASLNRPLLARMLAPRLGVPVRRCRGCWRCGPGPVSARRLPTSFRSSGCGSQACGWPRATRGSGSPRLPGRRACSRISCSAVRRRSIPCRSTRAARCPRMAERVRFTRRRAARGGRRGSEPAGGALERRRALAAHLGRGRAARPAVRDGHVLRVPGRRRRRAARPLVPHGRPRGDEREPARRRPAGRRARGASRGSSPEP